jgi:hypothetical protein
MSDSTITVDNLPLKAHNQWATDRAAYNPVFAQEAQTLTYEQSTSTRPIFRSAHELLFDLVEGAPTLALFEEPPIEARLPHHVFLRGEIFSLALTDNEALEWQKDRPTPASLIKLLGLEEPLAPESDEAKLVGFLEEWLFLQRLAAEVHFHTHKKKI